MQYLPVIELLRVLSLVNRATRATSTLTAIVGRLQSRVSYHSDLGDPEQRRGMVEATTVALMFRIIIRSVAI